MLATIFRTENEKVLLARLLGSRVAPPCARCGGCGSYSYNTQDGTRCFGCAGVGVVLPKSKAEWTGTVERAQALDVDAYLAGVAARVAAKGAADKVMAAWKASGISARYRWEIAADAKKALDAGLTLSPVHAEALRQSDLNAVCAKTFDHVRDLAAAYDRATTYERAPRPTLDALAAGLNAAVALALDVIATVERASVCVPAGLPVLTVRESFERTQAGIAALRDAPRESVAAVFGSGA